jgi:hypothetical protein
VKRQTLTKIGHKGVDGLRWAHRLTVVVSEYVCVSARPPPMPVHKMFFCVVSLCARLLRARLPQDGLDAALKTALLGTFFACAHPCVQSEKWHFGTGRWSWFGTRQVALTREEALMRFYRASLPGEPALSFAQPWAYFKDITAELLAMYLENQGKERTFTCTVAPGGVPVHAACLCRVRAFPC